MWTSFEVWMKYAGRRMQTPPANTQAGRDEFYRMFVQTDFLKKASKEGRSLGFEALFLRKDFIEAGIEPSVFMENQLDDGTDQIVLGHMENVQERKNSWSVGT